MFKQIQHRFHLSQSFASRENEHLKHSRSRIFLLLLVIFCLQLRTFDLFAVSFIPKTIKPPQSYVYIRTNPLIDDSWIGTLINFTKNIPIASKDLDPNSLGLNSANTLQVSNVIRYQDWKQFVNNETGLTQ